MVAAEKREPATGSLLPALAASLAGFLLYAFTCYPSPDWLDGPELAGAALRLGIFHPPGSPLAVMAGHLSVLWPFGPPAGALVYFSAVFAAASVYVMTRLIQDAWLVCGNRRGPSGNLFAMFAGLSFAVMPAVWIQASRLEVYSLALLLFLLSLRAMLAASTTSDPQVAGRQAEKALFFCGMGVATHPLIALGVLAGVPIVAASRTGWRIWFAPRRLVSHAFFFLLGCAPLFMIPLMVKAPVDLRWGDPGTLAGFVRFIAGLTFSHSFSFQSTGLHGGESQALLALVRGMGVPLAVAALIGIYLLIRTRPRLALALAFITLTGTLGLATQRGLRLDNPDVYGYILASAAALFFVAAVGLAAATRTLTASHPRVIWLLVALWPGLALGSALLSERPLDHSGCSDGRALALETLAKLPPSAVVLLADFNLVFMFDYLRWAESFRPDIDVVYLRDLKNSAMRTAMQAQDPVLEASLPNVSTLDRNSLGMLSRLRPLYLDSGPHLDGNLLSLLSPDGLLWRVRLEESSTDDDPLLGQADFFSALAPPVCEAGVIDQRSAEVVSWHAYWQALAAHATGRDVLAGMMLSYASCAAPRDIEIARTVADLGIAPLSVCLPGAEAQAAPPIGEAKQQPWRAVLLLLGLVLWLVGAIRQRKLSAKPWMAAGIASAGLLLVVLAIA